MIRLAAFFLLAATSALAQTPPPGGRQVRIDVSPAGQAVLKKYLGTRDPVVVQRVQALRSLDQQMDALSKAPRLDLARLDALMRRQEGLEAAIKRRNNDRSIAMLREMSEADRVRFIRSFRAARAGVAPPGR